MFLKQALQNTLRASRRSLLFLLLLGLISALLASSLGMSAALNQAMTLCRENYASIGLVEYIGGSYPHLAQLDENLSAAYAAVEDALPQEDAVIYYEPTAMAMGSIDGLPSHAPQFSEAVLLVKIIEVSEPWYDSSSNFYLATVTNALYSSRNVKDNVIYLDTGDVLMEKGRYYLVHGNYYSGIASYTSLGIEQYVSPQVQDLGETSFLDVTTEDGYSIPEDCIFYDIADTLAVQYSGLTLWSTDHPQDLYPFHEDQLTLSQGEWYGKDGCVVSETVASLLDLSLGDSITINVAADPSQLPEDSYWAGTGFLCQQEYTVTGFFTGTDDYLWYAFVPSMDRELTLGSYTLGHLRLENGSAQEYLDSLSLPSGVRVTLYDQGYAAVESTLGTMLRSVAVIAMVCLMAGLAFLVLYAYLLVYRQQGVALTMHRLGVSRKNILSYDVFCVLFTALPGCILGFVVSLFACNWLQSLVTSIIANESDLALYYSSRSLSVSRDAMEFLAPPSAVTLAIITLAVLAVSLVLGLAFGSACLKEKRHRRQRSVALRPVRSRSLRGGAMKYALLSASRGGLRSAVPALALLFACVLFCRLCLVTAEYETSLQELQENTSVRGYFTDSSGRKLNELVLNGDVLDSLAAIDGVSDITYSRSLHYDILGVFRGEEVVTWVGEHPRTDSTFGQESLMNFFATCPEIVFTNSLKGSPEFLYSTSIQTEYLEGYDETLFTSPCEDEDICMVPTTVMEEYGMSLGDQLYLEIAVDNGTFPMILTVVGSYVQEAASDRVYAPITLFESTGGMVSDGQIATSSASGRFHPCIHGVMSYQSATFSIKSCADLDNIKSQFYSLGLSEPHKLRSVRCFATINDSSYLSALYSSQQRLWYMQRLFPIIDVLAVALAFFLGRLLLGRRSGEVQTLRSMGASVGTVFWSLYLEQLMLCLLGVLLGLGCCTAFGWVNGGGSLWLAAFFLSWLLGALTALCRSNRRYILKTRRDQEA